MPASHNTTLVPRSHSQATQIAMFGAQLRHWAKRSLTASAGARYAEDPYDWDVDELGERAADALDGRA